MTSDVSLGLVCINWESHWPSRHCIAPAVTAGMARRTQDDSYCLLDLDLARLACLSMVRLLTVDFAGGLPLLLAERVVRSASVATKTCSDCLATRPSASNFTPSATRRSLFLSTDGADSPQLPAPANSNLEPTEVKTARNSNAELTR